MPSCTEPQTTGVCLIALMVWSTTPPVSASAYPHTSTKAPTQLDAALQEAKKTANKKIKQEALTGAFYMLAHIAKTVPAGQMQSLTSVLADPQFQENVFQAFQTRGLSGLLFLGTPGAKQIVKSLSGFAQSKGVKADTLSKLGTALRTSSGFIGLAGKVAFRVPTPETQIAGITLGALSTTLNLIGWILEDPKRRDAVCEVLNQTASYMKSGGRFVTHVIQHPKRTVKHASTTWFCQYSCNRQSCGQDKTLAEKCITTCADKYSGLIHNCRKAYQKNFPAADTQQVPQVTNAPKTPHKNSVFSPLTNFFRKRP